MRSLRDALDRGRMPTRTEEGEEASEVKYLDRSFWVVFLPIADKLEQRTRSETTNMRIVLEGIESIVKGENAIIVRERLDAFLAPAERCRRKRK